MTGLPALTAIISLVGATLLSGCTPSGRDTESAKLTQQVFETERAFARTMAARDHAAFTAFLSDEAVFFSGENPLRGKEQVAAWWKRYYEGPDAPFSWEPEKVEVLGSGTLALSTGPVHDPGGKLIGTFTSIWRQEEPGRWRIVFDRGNPACE
jgi:ketosteroid isomerase-like protein